MEETEFPGIKGETFTVYFEEDWYKGVNYSNTTTVIECNTSSKQKGFIKKLLDKLNGK